MQNMNLLKRMIKKTIYHLKLSLYILTEHKLQRECREYIACIFKSQSLHKGAKYPTTFIVLIALQCNYERIHMWRNFKEILAFVSIT